MRQCETCKAAENPLGRLRFKKFLDGKVYCENCLPPSLTPASPSGPPPSSAGYDYKSPPPGVPVLTVIPCPDCRGMSHKPHGKTCSGCAGYGSVRIPWVNLVVYQPKTKAAPQILTES